MDIRPEIGHRITAARKALGITIKELSARIKTLSPARISNWEQGTRSPGPTEAKLLADQLQVSASYLLCLTDNPQGELLRAVKSSVRYAPVLPLSEVVHAREWIAAVGSSCDKDKQCQLLVVDPFNTSPEDAALFALRIEDTSMQPELNPKDVILLDVNQKPKPGDLVAVYLPQKQQTFIRRFKEADGCQFQLLANNALWSTISINSEADKVMCGVVVEVRRYL